MAEREASVLRKKVESLVKENALLTKRGGEAGHLTQLQSANAQLTEENERIRAELKTLSQKAGRWRD